MSASHHQQASSNVYWRSEPLLERFTADPKLMAETERLLSGRTRDIRLKGKLSEAFRLRTWRQTANTIKFWMIWVILLDLLMASLNFLLLPHEIAVSMLAPSALIVPAALWVIYIWRTPRSQIALGGSLMAGDRKSVV